MTHLLTRLPWYMEGGLVTLQSHPTIGPTIKSCTQALLNLMIETHSPLTPVLNVRNFPLHYQSKLLQDLQNRGLFQFPHFLTHKGFLSLSGLMDTLGPYRFSVGQVLKLRHCLRALPSLDLFNRRLTPFEFLCESPYYTSR